MVQDKDNLLNFEKLEVWKISLVVIEKIYILIDEFPSKERFALSDQLRRATTSVSLNIAEGSGYYSKKSFINFLYQARGSIFEVVACLRIAAKLKYISENQAEETNLIIVELTKKLNSLIKYLKSKLNE